MVDFNAGHNRLTGRDRELAALESFLGAAAVGGATLLLAGEPGVGKTALLLAAAEMAAAAGVRVIRSGGVEYETDVSFAGSHHHLQQEQNGNDPVHSSVPETGALFGSR